MPYPEGSRSTSRSQSSRRERSVSQWVLQECNAHEECVQWVRYQVLQRRDWWTLFHGSGKLPGIYAIQAGQLSRSFPVRPDWRGGRDSVWTIAFREHLKAFNTAGASKYAGEVGRGRKEEHWVIAEVYGGSSMLPTLQMQKLGLGGLNSFFTKVYTVSSCRAWAWAQTFSLRPRWIHPPLHDVISSKSPCLCFPKKWKSTWQWLLVRERENFKEGSNFHQNVECSESLHLDPNGPADEKDAGLVFYESTEST